MRIMFVYESMARWGGIERIWTDKMNCLVRDYGVEVCLVTTIQGSHKAPYSLDSRVKWHDLGIQFHYSYRYRGLRKIYDQLKRRISFRRKLRQEIKTFNPDIISCVAVRYVPTIMKLKGEIPVIVESHGNCITTYHSNANKIVQFFERKMLYSAIKKADKLVALTKGDAYEWKKFNDNVVTIPNIAHLNDSGRYSTTSGKHVIFVGRLATQKGLPQLLDIWDIVHSQHSDWTLDVYGEGEMEEWLRSQDSFKDNNIVLHRPTSDIMERYIDSSIFVITSDYESFGLVITEAMSCGLPVVAFDCPYGPREIITDGKDGFLVKPNDCKGFAERICWLIEHPEERVKLGQAAVKSSQRYCSKNIMPKWIELYKSCHSRS